MIAARLTAIHHASSIPGRRGRLAAAATLALLAAGCQSRAPETTGSIGAASARGAGEAAGRREVEILGARYAADSADVELAMRYARALRATDQKPQAVAVLQQAALRNPKNTAVLAAYGKSLAEVGRFAEAAQVLQNAHTPAQPDWRVLSAQGAVADQTGDHKRAQEYYEAALKIFPDEPSTLSNLGLSYALAQRLDQAEATLRRAAAQPGADARVRQNLALVLGLKGRFAEAEAALRQDLSPEEAAANVASLRAAISQPNAWRAIRSADQRAPKAARTDAPRG